MYFMCTCVWMYVCSAYTHAHTYALHFVDQHEFNKYQHEFNFDLGVSVIYMAACLVPRSSYCNLQ